MAKTKSKYLPEPRGKEMRCGIKVSWQYYETEEQARSAAKVAEHNAEVAWQQGYDFGYQTPGSVRLMDDNLQGEWAKYSGLWEVCFP